ncbi:hypothetical protein BDN70DRAFT_570617 [Pholiota conissans]|uniref:Uncharacterized protein n=1 Tax=Pholiota conissans TaxID=109636 RepID=A0A9P5YMV0_9AGAR|nr:hypothetical protein BDN70DRAFT_570617 [Pholiota conissans]
MPICLSNLNHLASLADIRTRIRTRISKSLCVYPATVIKICYSLALLGYFSTPELMIGLCTLADPSRLMDWFSASFRVGYVGRKRLYLLSSLFWGPLRRV